MPAQYSITRMAAADKGTAWSRFIFIRACGTIHSLPLISVQLMTLWKFGKMGNFNMKRRRWRGPALGGPLQRGARYCFAASDGEATTAQLTEWCRPKIVHAGGKPTAFQMVNQCTALRSIGAVKVRREGRQWVWRPRDINKTAHFQQVNLCAVAPLPWLIGRAEPCVERLSISAFPPSTRRRPIKSASCARSLRA
jgi:hypothetical protein